MESNKTSKKQINGSKLCEDYFDATDQSNPEYSKSVKETNKTSHNEIYLLADANPIEQE